MTKNIIVECCENIIVSSNYNNFPKKLECKQAALMNGMLSYKCDGTNEGRPLYISSHNGKWQLRYWLDVAKGYSSSFAKNIKTAAVCPAFGTWSEGGKIETKCADNIGMRNAYCKLRFVIT